MYFFNTNFLILIIINVGVTMYIPKFKTMVEIPNPNTSTSEPSFTNDIIESVESIGAIIILITSLNMGFTRSHSDTVGEYE